MNRVILAAAVLGGFSACSGGSSWYMPFALAVGVVLVLVDLWRGHRDAAVPTPRDAERARREITGSPDGEA